MKSSKKIDAVYRKTNRLNTKRNIIGYLIQIPIKSLTGYLEDKSLEIAMQVDAILKASDINLKFRQIELQERLSSKYNIEECDRVDSYEFQKLIYQYKRNQIKSELEFIEERLKHRVDLNRTYWGRYESIMCIEK